MSIEEKLQKLEITYEKVEHPAVYTVEEAKEKVPKIDGIGCKNLFLRTQKKECFLYTLPEDKQINLKSLVQIVHPLGLIIFGEHQILDHRIE